MKPLTLALALSATPAAAQDLSLMLDWFVNPDHAPIIVAQEMGFFADAGLTVAITAPADPSDPPRMLASGQVDLAVGYQPQLHLQVHEGLPLTRIATLVATPLNCVTVLADGPVQSIAGLKGRTVGYSVPGMETTLMSAMLDRAGLSLDDVDLRLLAELQADGRITNQALADKVALSPSACLARVRRLEAEGLILGYTAWAYWVFRGKVRPGHGYH